MFDPDCRPQTLEPRRRADIVVVFRAIARIAEIAVAQGMRRLREDGLEKVKQGRTSIAEVSRVTSSGA